MEDKYLIVSLLLLLIFLVVGLWPSNNYGKEAFLISNRKLKGISNGFTIAASKIGGGLLITYSVFFFKIGWWAIFYFVGIIFGYLIFWKFAKKLKLESDTNNFYTVGDYFSSLYGREAGRNIGIITALSVFGWILTNLVAGGILLGYMTGYPFWLSTTVLGLIIGIYVYFGGFNSVVRTDVIQYIALMVLFGFFAYISFSGFEINREILTSTKAPIGEMIGFFLLGAFFPMGSAELWQRIYAGENLSELRKAIWISSISYIGLGIILSLICVTLLSNGSVLMGLDDQMKLAIGVQNLVAEKNILLPVLWMLAFLSAIISSSDTYIYTTASALVQDVVAKSKAEQKDENITQKIKNIVIILIIIGVVISALGIEVQQLTSLFVGITLVLSALAYWSWLKKSALSYKVISWSGTLGVLSVFIAFFASGGNSLAAISLIGFAVVSISIIIANVFKLKN